MTKVPFVRNYEFVSWDWKEQPPLKEINSTMKEVGKGKPTQILEIEYTGNDSYYIIITDDMSMTEEGAQKCYDSLMGTLGFIK